MNLEIYPIMAVMSLLVLVCACSGKIASWMNMPCLILFLGVGMLAGSEGIGGIAFDDANVANLVGSMAMAFILLSGGFDTDWKQIRPALKRGGLLSSAGVLLTALFVGVFAYLVLSLAVPEYKLPLSWCLLLGATVSSTDAAAVFSILRSKSVSLRGGLKPLLEFESGSNDPMAAFLTVFLLEIARNETLNGTAAGLAQYAQIVPMFCMKMVIGVAVGWLAGRAAVRLLDHIDLEFDGLYYVMAIGLGLFAFSVAELAYGNGFMAVYVTGIVMGNRSFTLHNSIGRFYDGFAWLMQVILFAMLGLLVFPTQIWEVKWLGLAVALFLMVVARPLAVLLCLAKSEYSLKERLFVSWVGLRGGAPIMLATFPLLASLPQANLLFHIVFFTVLLSVLLQGATIMPLARWLHLDAPLASQPRAPLMFEQTHNMDGLTRNFEIISGSPQDGCELAKLGLPKGALVLLIRREGRFIVPVGSTVIQAADELMVIGSENIMEDVARLLDNRPQ